MNLKLIGAVLIISCSTWFGLALCGNYRYEERTLRQLLRALDFMGCELQYRITALPELCRMTSVSCRGVISQVFCSFAKELEDQISPDAGSCMKAVIAKTPKIPRMSRTALLDFSDTLGCFDMQGQLIGLEAARQACKRNLDSLSENREIRLRSYQTLGICTGAALIVLLI